MTLLEEDGHCPCPKERCRNAGVPKHGMLRQVSNQHLADGMLWQIPNQHVQYTSQRCNLKQLVKVAFRSSVLIA